jgi:hypothetical protein
MLMVMESSRWIQEVLKTACWGPLISRIFHINESTQSEIQVSTSPFSVIEQRGRGK